jgi:hypothetical protein
MWQQVQIAASRLYWVSHSLTTDNLAEKRHLSCQSTNLDLIGGGKHHPLGDEFTRIVQQV